MDELHPPTSSEPVGRVARMRARRVTRYGLGFYAWLPFTVVGFSLVVAGARGVFPGWWQSALCVVAGLGCLAFAWTVLTSTDPEKRP